MLVVSGTEHLVNEYRLGLEFFVEWLVVLVDQDAQGYFILATTIKIYQPLRRRLQPQKQDLLPRILQYDLKCIVIDVLLLIHYLHHVVSDQGVLLVDHVQVQH